MCRVVISWFTDGSSSNHVRMILAEPGLQSSDWERIQDAIDLCILMERKTLGSRSSHDISDEVYVWRLVLYWTEYRARSRCTDPYTSSTLLLLIEFEITIIFFQSPAVLIHRL